MSWVKIPLETDGGTWTLHLVNNLEKMKKVKTTRVDVYSVPSNKTAKIRCFVDIPQSKVGELIAWLITNGLAVTKNAPKFKK